MPATPPTFRAAVSAKGNSATAAPGSNPGTVAAGDVGLLVVCNNEAMGSPTAAPSGWTEVLATTGINGKQRVTIYTRIFVAGDAAPSVSFGSAANWSAAAAWWSGAAGVGVIGSFSGAASGSASSAGAASTSSDQNAVVTIATHYFGGSGFATSAGVSPDATVRHALFGTATFNHSIWIGDATKASAGATNTQTITWDSAGTALGGIQVALLPTIPPQVWVPTSDTGATITGWTKTPSGAAGVYAVLADSDPASYIESGDNPTSLVWQSQTFAMAKPADLTTAKVKVSGYLATGTTGSRLIQLYQGATLIKQQTISSLTGSNVETIVSLNSTEAGSITTTSGMWNNLSIKVTDTAS